MKRILITIAVLLTCAVCHGQSPEVQKFIERWQTENVLISDMMYGEDCDYSIVREKIIDLIEDYDDFPFEDGEQFEIIQAYNYYNLACAETLGGNMEEAIKALYESVEYGYMDGQHMSQDEDLISLHGDERFDTLVANLIEHYIIILRESDGYERGSAADLPAFTYQDQNHPDLVRVREYFDLDAIAGDGDEISQIKNLTTWLHDTVRHDGSSYNPKSKNAIDMIELCRKENRGVNCRMLAQILNECYLAMGFESRYVTCMPKEYINDCHVINMVYSKSLGKWLWMDPSFNAWVSDEHGNLLGIEEVRQYLIDGKTLVLNEEANWNNETKQTAEHYLHYYMAKNLYYVSARADSEYDSETESEGKQYSPMISLYPTGYLPEEVHRTHVGTNDDAYFWQAPAK